MVIRKVSVGIHTQIPVYIYYFIILRASNEIHYKKVKVNGYQKNKTSEVSLKYFLSQLILRLHNTIFLGRTGAATYFVQKLLPGNGAENIEIGLLIYHQILRIRVRVVELLWVHILLAGYPLTNIRRVPRYPFIGCRMF